MSLLFDLNAIVLGLWLGAWVVTGKYGALVYVVRNCFVSHAAGCYGYHLNECEKSFHGTRHE
jgi:hypothetical protein